MTQLITVQQDRAIGLTDSYFAVLFRSDLFGSQGTERCQTVSRMPHCTRASSHKVSMSVTG